jgi:Zn-finger nucleic acid-binding protein
MQCPIDKVDLVMADRNGIEIDYCPKCRGVWLDRGELDKVIERAGSASAAPVDEPRDRREYRRDDDRDRHLYNDRPHHGDRPHYKKRKSFLDDIFDF